MYGFEKGSFVGSNFSSGGAGPPQQNFIVANRDSNLTQFNYDENSLMNLSISPSVYRSSHLTNNMTKTKEEKTQMSSDRFNTNNRATTSEMGRIMEDRNEE
jgi:hypothetical protein